MPRHIKFFDNNLGKERLLRSSPNLAKNVGDDCPGKRYKTKIEDLRDFRDTAIFLNIVKGQAQNGWEPRG